MGKITRLPQCSTSNRTTVDDKNNVVNIGKWSPATVDYQLFDDFTNEFDSLLELHDKISKIRWLMHHGFALETEQLAVLEDFKYQDVKAACGRIQRLEKVLDPDEAYVDGVLRRDIIMQMLAALLMSFPSYRANPTHSMRLLQETARVQPKLYVLEGACRHWVRNEDWPPVPAQMLRTLDEQEKLWERRWWAADHIVEDQQALLSG